MSDDRPIRSALEAERNARRAVEQAGEEAADIRRRARERARTIARRTEERAKRLHDAVVATLEKKRRDIEHDGAEMLKQLRRDAIDDAAMARAIDAVVTRIMAGPEDSEETGQ